MSDSRGITARQPGTAGGEAADPLAAAYDACAAKLFRHALMILADPAAAEDAVHQAFVKLVASGKLLAELNHRERYLRVAVRNECYRILQQRRARAAAPLQDADLLAAAEDRAGSEEERLAIERALRKLPPDQREVVHLRIYEGLAFQQIAELTGVSINTVASRYRYAIDKLREQLADLRETGVQP